MHIYACISLAISRVEVKERERGACKIEVRARAHLGACRQPRPHCSAITTINDWVAKKAAWRRKRGLGGLEGRESIRGVNERTCELICIFPKKRDRLHASYFLRRFSLGYFIFFYLLQTTSLPHGFYSVFSPFFYIYYYYYFLNGESYNNGSR